MEGYFLLTKEEVSDLICGSQIEREGRRWVIQQVTIGMGFVKARATTEDDEAEDEPKVPIRRGPGRPSRNTLASSS
jgi:hypothetical protein